MKKIQSKYIDMDNFWKNCPAKMEDGRHLTDYRTAVRREEYVKYINNIVRDDEYKQFLTTNAEKITKNEWDWFKQNKNCWTNECVHNYPTRVHPPWFVEEKQKYNSLANPNRLTQYTCPKMNDYRTMHVEK